LASIGTPACENFDTLASSGTSGVTPLGWALSESGTAANGFYTAGNGSSNSGDTYSFGTGTATERAFGGLQSGSLIPTIGAVYANNTGQSIGTLTIAYTGEQWRLGATGRTDRLDFQYSTDATSLTTGTWIDVDQLDFNAPNSTGTVGPLDGNLPANRATVTFAIGGLSIPTGTTFWIRWNDFNAAGADDGLGVDDFCLTPGAGVAATPTPTPSVTPTPITPTPTPTPTPVTPTPTPTPTPATNVIINELDSDTPGTDVAEFIELYDGGVGNTSLNGLVVVLYNGADDLSYAAFDLDGFSTNGSGYFTLGNAGVPGVGLVFANGLLQNGADAAALYADDAANFPNGTPVTTVNLRDAIVYDTSDPDDPGLLVLLIAGLPQVD
jgi:hypothetical protein